MINMIHGDCMEYMATLPDKAFELAIIDPPYGINMDGGRIGGNNIAVAKDYIKKNWDGKAPDKAYFDELIRVSKNQIIFGGNHFISKIPYDSPCWIVWDKENSGNFADCELAWTSFNTAVRKFSFMWNGMLQGDMKNKEARIHPTQKPVALYKWLLQNYAKPGDRILDTHGGSGSICIACHDLGFDLTWMEKDEDYYNAARKRYNEHAAQGELFGAKEIQENVYQQAVMI